MKSGRVRAGMIGFGGWMLCAGGVVHAWSANAVFAQSDAPTVMSATSRASGEGDARKGAVIEPGTRRRIELAPNVVIELTYVAPGEFIQAKGGDYPSKGMRFLRQAFGATKTKKVNEGPERRTKITQGMWVMTTRVPADAFSMFMNELPEDKDRPAVWGYHPRNPIELWDKKYTPIPGCEKTPVNTATHSGAEEFAKWLSTRTGETFRLPTEAEWEFIARGPAHRETPKGSNPPVPIEAVWAQHAKCWTPCAEAENITPEGVCDLLGRGGEWVADIYADSLDPKDMVDPKGPKDGPWRVMRGRFSLTSREPALSDSPTHEWGGWSYCFRLVSVQGEGDGPGAVPERTGGGTR